MLQLLIYLLDLKCSFVITADKADFIACHIWTLCCIVIMYNNV